MQTVTRRTTTQHPDQATPVLRHQHTDALSRVVERALAHALPPSSRTPQALHEAMRYCVLSGGKRFRPLLCLGACEAVGVRARRALPVACAIELIHTYSLVHDDLPAMDDAEERRGQPSCHRRFDEGTAVLAGDALLTLAFALLARNGTPNTLAIIRTLGEACGTTGLIGGQALDLAALRHPAPAGEGALREIARRKTAALITGSVVSGGLAGDAGAPALAALRRYGQGIGLAFQLIDDLHDRDGLAAALGPGGLRREADRAIAGAVRALDRFGDRAKTLRALASRLAATAET